jgi:Omp85 superfamily domain
MWTRNEGANELRIQVHRTRSVGGRGAFGLAGAVLAVVLGAPDARAAAQATDTPADAAGRVTVVAGHYPAGAFRRLMLGSNYRDLWQRPVSLAVLDLQREAGGLKPLRRVGGQQTHGLALVGADGRSYTFRGLVKNVSHMLDDIDPELSNSEVIKVLDDLMSAQHPASEVIAHGLLDATGIPCPAWRLVTLPDDPALGEFQKDFAGAFGVFAEYPQPAKGAVTGFLGATEIVDHLEFYKRIEAGEAVPDTQALLRARLMDIFMGDWDRHRKQWRWAKIPGKATWTAIPEDRDQAFSRYGGFVLARTRARDPRFQNFGPRYPKIGGLTSNGSEQDRRLLVGLSRQDFVEAAKALQAQLTDEAIEKAARQMPPEWYAIDGARLTAALRARRDALTVIAERFYERLADSVDVYLTNENEHVDAKRLGNGDMDVTITVEGRPEPTFHRVFHEGETDEVRLYTLGGDDTVKVTGTGGPRVRMIGGTGNDTLDATGAGNAKLSDSQGQNRAMGAGDDEEIYAPPPPPKNASWVPPRDWGHKAFGIPVVAYNADLGLFLGYSFQIQSFGFRKHPYASSHVVSGGWAFGEAGGRIDYLGDFRRENRASHFGLYTHVSGVEVLRFFGLGNEITAPAANQDFYKVSATQYVLYPTLRVPFSKKGLFTIGPALKYTANDQSKNQFINTVEPYGSDRFGEVGVHSVLSWDGRDSVVFPRHGVLAAVRGSWIAKAWDSKSSFGQVNGNFNVYLPVGGALTIAERVGGKHVFGTYPYFEAAPLGQGGLGAGALAEPENTLRGYRARRYLGDSSAYSNTDLRLRISRLNILVPGAWGLTAFGDVGRVWLAGETSDTWHTGVGGGIWLSFLANRSVLSVGLAHGKEENLFYLKGGFAF